MFERIKSTIRNYFGFSRMETNGTMILFFLILIFIALPLFLDSLLSGSEYLIDQDARILDSLIAQLREKESPAPEEPVQVELFQFDPNKIGKDDFIRLGLQEPVAQRIINYRQAGGRFRIKSDLRKIYGFPESDFLRLERFIDLPDTIKSSPPSIKNPTVLVNAPASLFDINNADTADLISIKGIGKILASRILKFRQSLGGYTNENQYFEIYGLPKETAFLLQESSFIKDGFVPKQINLNFSNQAELQKHPYIDRSLSGKIIMFRDANGPFTSNEQVKESGIMPDSVFYKLQPYMTF